MVFIAAAGLLAAALLCWYVSFLPPVEGRFWGVISLSAPMVLVANGVAFFVLLLCRCRRLALMPLVALLFNVQYLLSMVQFTLPSSEEYDLRIASLNADNFQWKEDAPSRLSELVEAYKREQFDIVCLQEYVSEWVKIERDSVDEVLKSQLGLYLVSDAGAAILSKYPIVSSDYQCFEDSGNDYIWADIKTPKDTIRVISVHLQTSGISALRSQYEKDTLHKEIPIDEVVSTLEKNNRMRVRQVKTLNAIIDTTRHPVILLGDFNDTPSSHTYRKINDRLNDAYREAGNGWGATFRPYLGVLRIDYIFYDNTFDCTRFMIHGDPISDHKLVSAKLKFVD